MPSFPDGGPLRWLCGEPAQHSHKPGQDTSNKLRLLPVLLTGFHYDRTPNEPVKQQEDQSFIRINKRDSLPQTEETAAKGTSTDIP